MSAMILEKKNAVIYGGGGSLGAAVGKALARAGAHVTLVGRNLARVRKVADEIAAHGGRADAVVADATKAEDVAATVERIARERGSLDISFCAINYEVVQNVPLVELNPEDFVRPVTLAMRSNFLTATAAGRAMVKQRSGVILSLTATPGGIGYPYTAGFATACAAIECFSRNLASELGPHAVRVVNIRSGGSPDSQVFVEAREKFPKEMEGVLRGLENDTMLKRMPPMEDVANVAVFLVSDAARSITGVTVDVTAGTTAALNHRVPRAEDKQNNWVGPSGPQ
jgi:3-oxoacyl-[acyl-carrier protein] reductase